MTNLVVLDTVLSKPFSITVFRVFVIVLASFHFLTSFTRTVAVIVVHRRGQSPELSETNSRNALFAAIFNVASGKASRDGTLFRTLREISPKLICDPHGASTTLCDLASPSPLEI